MGILVHVLCHCGYYDSSMQLAVGCGFAGIEAEQEGLPACCHVCHEVVGAPDDRNPECPMCSNRVDLYTNPSMQSSAFPEGDPSGPAPVGAQLHYRGNRVYLPPPFYKCPKCGEYRLRFTSGGCWD